MTCSFHRPSAPRRRPRRPRVTPAAPTASHVHTSHGTCGTDRHSSGGCFADWAFSRAFKTRRRCSSNRVAGAFTVCCVWSVMASSSKCVIRVIITHLDNHKISLFQVICSRREREVTPVELFQKRSSGELVCVSLMPSRLKLRTLCSTPTDPRSECAQTKEEKQKGRLPKPAPLETYPLCQFGFKLLACDSCLLTRAAVEHSAITSAQAKACRIPCCRCWSSECLPQHSRCRDCTHPQATPQAHSCHN